MAFDVGFHEVPDLRNIVETSEGAYGHCGEAPASARAFSQPDVIHAYGDDGSLFMAATDETFATANCVRIAAARSIAAVVDPLNFILPFDTEAVPARSSQFAG